MIELTLEIKQMYAWYRESSEEWVVTINSCSEHVSQTQNYTGKTLEEAKENAMNVLTSGLLGTEIEYLFKKGVLSIEERKI